MRSVDHDFACRAPALPLASWTSLPSADEIRAGQRTAWSGLAAGWEKWHAVIAAQLRPVGTAMIERLHIAADQQHLDIASGTGEPGLSIAPLAPEGRVVLTDLVQEMLDIAVRRASAAPMTCPSMTHPSTASRFASDTCSCLTWRRPPRSWCEC
jgi:hypothetical protein